MSALYYRLGFSWSPACHPAVLWVCLHIPVLEFTAQVYFSRDTVWINLPKALAHPRARYSLTCLTSFSLHACVLFLFFWVEAAVFQSVWAGWLHSVCLDQNKSWWSGSLFVPQLVASSVRAWWTIGATQTQTHKVGLIESRAFTAGLWCWLTEDNLCLPPLGWVRRVEWTERWRGSLSRVCAWGLGGFGMCGLLVCVHDCRPSLSSFITLRASRLISVDRSGCVAASASLWVTAEAARPSGWLFCLSVLFLL